MTGFSLTDYWSCSQQVTEVFLEPQEGQASRERRAMSASPESDFQGPPAPKVNLQDKPAPEWDHCSAHGPFGPPPSHPFPGWLAPRAVAILFIPMSPRGEEAMHVNTLLELVTRPPGELAEFWRIVNAVTGAAGWPGGVETSGPGSCPGSWQKLHFRVFSLSARGMCRAAGPRARLGVGQREGSWGT